MENEKTLDTSSSPAESYKSLERDLPRYGFKI